MFLFGFGSEARNGAKLEWKEGGEGSPGKKCGNKRKNSKEHLDEQRRKEQKAYQHIKSEDRNATNEDQQHANVSDVHSCSTDGRIRTQCQVAKVKITQPLGVRGGNQYYPKLSY